MSNGQSIKVWCELSHRSDLVGKRVRFDDRVGDLVSEGTISAIRVAETGPWASVIIDCDDLRERPLLPHDNNDWGNPKKGIIRFSITDEDPPPQNEGTIWYDLDERRQLRIDLFYPKQVDRRINDIREHDLLVGRYTGGRNDEGMSGGIPRG